MSDKVTASVAGSRLPPDSRAPTYNFRRQKRNPDENEAQSEADTLSIDISQTRYRETGRSDPPDFDDAVSFSQTQAAFLGVVQKSLDRMGELSVLCQDATKTDADRAGFTVEFTQLQNFISDIGTKKFNGVALFGGVNLKVGNEADGSFVPLNTIEWGNVSVDQGVAMAYDPKATDIHSSASANVALGNIRKALGNLGAMQSKVSANLQRLSLTREQLLVLNENLSAASNRINDIDWAKKITDLARFRILREAGAAKSAQANATPQTAIRLLDSNR